MTRSQCKVSDTQVTVKACGPLVNLAKRKMVVRKGARPWSSEELAAINSFFSDQIGELKVPGKQQCEAAKAKFAEALKGRDWRSIKFCVYNKIQTHRKQGE